MFPDVDTDVVRSAIAENEHVIEVLDLEMEEHMRALRQLQYKKEQHKAEIRRWKGMITLANHLPPEILASIFEECVNDGWTRTPLVVSHVCLNWRKAASIPTVWSSVYVNLDARDPYNRTRLWLEKSQDTPLMIVVEIGTEVSQIDRIMKLLTTEASRWKFLAVKSAMLHPANQLLQRCNLPVPQLVSLKIVVAQEFSRSSATSDNDISAIRNAFLDAPQLRYLLIERNLLPFPNVIPTFITHLSFQLPSSSITTQQSIIYLLHLLNDLPKLVSLSIEVPNGHLQSFEMDADAEQIFELPHLKRLTLMGFNNIFGLLPHLKLASLTDLHLRSSLESCQAEATGHWIEQFLEISGFLITLLEIRDIALDASIFGQILPFLPKLQELRLHDCDIHDTLLEQLHSQKGLCTFLEHLDLRWCGRFTGRALVDLVRSRLVEEEEKKSSKRITHVTVINCSFVKEDDILDLAQMSTCRLIHKGSDDFCNAFGCCDNERYRKRLKRRLLFSSSVAERNLQRLVL